MTFSTGRMTDCEGRIQRDFIEFARLWADVRQDWLDQRCRQFEQQHLASLGPSLNRFAASLQDLREAIHRANRELQDDQQAADQRLN